MNTDKIKSKIAAGHTDEEIAAMAGITVEEINKIRTPAKPKPAPKAAPKKAATSKKKK